VRYREHRNDVAFHELGLRTCALAECDQWGVKLKAAVQSDLNKAQQQSIAYVEVGGWALAKSGAVPEKLSGRLWRLTDWHKSSAAAWG